jgi:hypothetical protein
MDRFANVRSLDKRGWQRASGWRVLAKEREVEKEDE